MAVISSRAASALQTLLIEGVLTFDECRVQLPEDDFARPVVDEVRRRYMAEETSASEDDVRTLLKTVLGRADASSGDAERPGPRDEAPDEQKIYWRLHGITAHNYRGLTEWEGEEFTHDFMGKPCHIFGPNGSGKTGILSAIVWCLTGACLRERSEPDGEVCGVTLYEDESGTECVCDDWPEVVTVPHSIAGQELAELGPHCCVEVELVAGDRRVVVQRTLPEGGSVSELTITEDTNQHESLLDVGITELDLETTLLMPARVSALQFAPGSKFSDNLLAVSGLKALREIGALANNLGTAVKRLENKRRKEAEAAVEQAVAAAKQATCDEAVADSIRDALREAEEACPQNDGETGPAHYGRLYRAQQMAVEELASEQFAEIERAIATEAPEEEQPAEKQPLTPADRKRIADALIRAKALIEQTEVHEWAPLADWLGMPADADAIATRVQEWARTTRGTLRGRYPTWLENKTARGRLDVRIRAAKYMRATGQDEECPVCEQELPAEIKEQLQELASRKVADTQALRVLVSELREDLRGILTQAAPGVQPEAPLEQLEAMLTKRVVAPMRDLGRLQQETLAHWADIVAEFPDWEWGEAEAPLADAEWDADFVAELVALEDDYAQALKTCQVARWAEDHVEGFAARIEDLVNTTTERLAELESYARQHDDLARVAAALGGAAKKCEEAASQLDAADDASRVHAVLNALAGLDEYAKVSLDADLVSTGASMQESYGVLYPNDPIAFGGLTDRTAKKGAKPDFRCTLKWSDDLFVDADPVSNAGRMRGILWAYTFALIRAHDPALKAIALHDPYLSLDDYAAQNMMTEVIVKGLGDRYQPLATVSEEHYVKPVLGSDPDQERFATLRVLRRGANHRHCRIAPGLDQLRLAINAYDEDADMWKPVVEATRPYLEDNLKLVAGSVLPGDYSQADLAAVVQALGAVATGKGSPTPLGERVRGALQSLMVDLEVDLEAPTPAVPNSSLLFHALHHGGPGQAKVSPVHADHARARYPRWSGAFSAVFDTIDAVLGRAETTALVQAESLPPADHTPPLTAVRLRRQIACIGRVAADGRWTVVDREADQSAEYTWPELEFALVTEDTCAPIALPGQIAIFAPEAEVSDSDLAMIGSGDDWHLRRVFRAILADGEGIGWVGQTVNPLVRNVAPVVRRSDDVQLRKLVGVLYERTPPQDLAQVPAGSEVARMGSPWPQEVVALNAGRASLIQVSGDSAEPVALDGQYLVVVPARLDEVTDGSLCAIRLSDGTHMVKRFVRLCRDSGRALLQPINAQAGYPTIEVRTSAPGGGTDEAELPHIEKLLVVRGVLFDAPEALGGAN